MIGALLIASVGLQVEEITDLPDPQPLLAEIASAIETRTGQAVEICPRSSCAASDDVVLVRLIGGVRRLLVVAERRGNKVRVELELEPVAWRTPVWGAIRTIFPEVGATLEPPPPPVQKRGSISPAWLVGGAALAAGTVVLVHSAILRGDIAHAGPEQTPEVFRASVDQLHVERALGAGLVAGALGGVLVALIWDLVD